MTSQRGHKLITVHYLQLQMKMVEQKISVLNLYKKFSTVRQYISMRFILFA